jgi:hypothetical protein
MQPFHTSAGAIYLTQIFASAFLAILFLQSGIDKIVHRGGNLEWVKGHFAKSPLAGIVPALLICITILVDEARLLRPDATLVTRIDFLSAQAQYLAKRFDTATTFFEQIAQRDSLWAKSCAF